MHVPITCSLNCIITYTHDFITSQVSLGYTTVSFDTIILSKFLLKEVKSIDADSSMI